MAKREVEFEKEIEAKKKTEKEARRKSMIEKRAYKLRKAQLKAEIRAKK